MRYNLKSKKTGQEVTVEYDEEELMLVTLQFDTPPSQEAARWLTQNLPVTQSDFLLWTRSTPSLTVTEVTQEATFDDFWEAYGHKVGRANAESQWKKLKPADRRKALSKCQQYHDWRKRQSAVPAPLHPERYLKYRRFDDNFAATQ